MTMEYIANVIAIMVPGLTSANFVLQLSLDGVHLKSGGIIVFV